MDELQRLEELRKEAIENPLKKKRGCKDCKKKANQEVTAIEVVVPEEEMVTLPTIDDIKLALDLMVGKPNDNDAKHINWVYGELFGEAIQPGCGNCGNVAYRKLQGAYNRMRGIKG
jgi:hypothetical protein